MFRVRPLLLLSTLVVVGPAQAAAAQGEGVIRGVVYDSLLRAPLAGAEVWLRGTERRTVTGGDGRFGFDSVAAGRYGLAVSHPGLDSAGFYTIASPLTVGNDTARVTVATPSLATLWRRRCGVELGSRPDSGLLIGLVQDAATGAHLAGAALIVSWLRLTRIDNLTLRTDNQDTRASTDSIGVYDACGVALDMTLRVRAYAGSDSTGLIDVRLGARGVARLDLTIARAAPGAMPLPRTAALRGAARATDGQPLPRARVIVHEAGSRLTDDDGQFLLSGLPAGTQWVSIQAIGRERFEQAVALRAGDTTALDVALGPLPVTLDPVRVLGTRGVRAMEEFERRRRTGSGYARTEDDIKRMGSLRGVFSTIPSVRIQRARSAFDLTVLLPRGAGGLCVAPLFIDGERADYDELRTYRTAELVGVEVYPRASTVPQEFQSAFSTCGVVLVWTKYLR